MPSRLICLDFDGVVHSYTSGWQGPRTIPDPPVDGALEFIHRALVMGYRVAIYSSRSRYLGGRRAMRRWMKRNTWPFWWDSYKLVEFPRFKPAAFVTLDDRAITFSGTFPELEMLGSFKTWQER